METLLRKSALPALLIIGGLVILLAAMLIIPRSEPVHEPLTQETPSDTHVAVPFPEVARASLIESKQAFDRGEAIFLDVRETDSYTMSHIPGAMNIPTNELPSRLTELDPDEWIITYCT